MAKSIASINSLLVSLKTVNNALPLKLQQLGFNTGLHLGAEQEYTVKTLMNAIDTLAVQFLTITANRNQFIQRTSYNERMEIESCLNSLLSCLQQTKLELSGLQAAQIQCDANMALFYTSENKEYRSLKLLDAVHFIDMIKPYCRMLEMIIAQERIHALSAVLETLLNKENTALTETDNELTEEQSNAIELSQYLIRQAL